MLVGRKHAVIVIFATLHAHTVSNAQLQACRGTNLGTSLSAFYENTSEPANSLFSAFSIESCASLVYPGAAGQTADQMSELFGFDPDQSPTSVFQEYRGMEDIYRTTYDLSLIHI